MSELTPRGERFPRWVRLTQRAEFQKVYDGGRKCARRFVVVYALDRGLDRPTRLGLTVSRRVGNAVTRNRVKRRLREIFRRTHATLPPGLDLVVNARVAAAGASYRQLEEDFRACVAKLLESAPPPLSSPVRDSSAEG